MLGDALAIGAHGVVSYVHFHIREYLNRFLEAFESAGEELAPLQTLALGISIALEMDHLSHVRVIPAPEGDAWNDVFVIDEAERPRREETGIVIAKVVQPNTRLAESVDPADRSDDFVGQERKSRAG